MYESFYGFTSQPFAAVPLKNLYFPSSSMESARANLIRCIERGEGCGLVMGPTGSGISLLCQLIAAHCEQHLETILLANLRLTNCREMLQAILYKLGIPHENPADGELRLAVVEALSPGGRCPRGLALIVDEAHLLSARVLEELRCMTNLVRDMHPCVRLVLAGGSSLEERFAHPRLAQINQRVAVRCYLHPLSAEESYQYIRSQTEAAGTHPDRLWSTAALRAIHRYTDGLPRLINQLCNHALLLAAKANVPQLGGEEIEHAWNDFQQLPTTTAISPEGSETGGESRQVVEFANLDEPDEAVPDIATEVIHESKKMERHQSMECQTAERDVSESRQAKIDAPESYHQHSSDLATEQNTPMSHVSVSEFVGIEANHVLILDSASSEKATSMAVETQTNVATDPNPESTAAKLAPDRESNGLAATEQPIAALADFSNAHCPPDETHPLIPLQTGVLAELRRELQETHLSRNKTLRNLVTS